MTSILGWKPYQVYYVTRGKTRILYGFLLARSIFPHSVNSSVLKKPGFFSDVGTGWPCSLSLKPTLTFWKPDFSIAISLKKPRLYGVSRVRMAIDRNMGWGSVFRGYTVWRGFTSRTLRGIRIHTRLLRRSPHCFSARAAGGFDRRNPAAPAVLKTWK